MGASADIHGMEPEAFREHVHSFEFWFGSVEGYLSGRSYGCRADTPEVELGETERDRLVTALCNYCVGETAALDGASSLVAIAPNRDAKIFLATQAADEARHLEVLLHRLGELGVTEPEAEIEARASRPLLAFKRRLLELVSSRDWEASLFAQNVILEAMEFAVFRSHARRADPRTREMLEGIVADERRHMGFGENDLGRRLAQTPHIRARLAGVRGELDRLILDTFEQTQEMLEVPRSEREELGRSYLEIVSRLGFDA